MKRFFKRLFLTVIILLVLVVGFFITTRKLDNGVAEMQGFYIPEYKQEVPLLLPSLFIDGERFYIKMASASGDTLLAFGDSGGGISMLPAPVADKFKLDSKVHLGLLRGLMPFRYICFSDLVTDAHIPPPDPLRSFVIRRPFGRVTVPTLFVPPMDDEVKFIMKSMPFDIFLGQNFFMGKAWTIDYKNQQVWVNTPVAASETGKPGVQHVGFKKNKNKENVNGHGSFFIEVDGEVIEVLFDTGATIVLSENGKKLLRTNRKTIGGSFIAASVFDKWQQKHPEWKCYPKSDMNSDIIEVPKITIGGNEVGPVLFAKRNDEVWSQGMIQTMDTVVKGAIGGSALKYLKVMIDYNTDLIKFEK